MHVVSATALYRLPGRTTLNGTAQLTSQNQDETLIPWTINSVINTPGVFAAFPHLAQLPRSTAQGEARGINTLVNLSTRPARRMSVTVRYRYNDRDVRTPPFDATEYVRFDAVPEELAEGISHQFDTSRQIVDASLSFTPGSFGTLRVGYGHEAVERHGRGFADVGEHIFRTSFDAFSSRFVTVRAAFDAARRRGEGFVETGVDYEVGPGGTQPTLRYFDEADRDRTRGSLLVTVMPRDVFDCAPAAARWDVARARVLLGAALGGCRTDRRRDRCRARAGVLRVPAVRHGRRRRRDALCRRRGAHSGNRAARDDRRRDARFIAGFAVMMSLDNALG